MRLKRARIQGYRSILDTGWFDIETNKTILVGPNEVGKTVILQALQQLNAPEDIEGFDYLRDYPRSKLNEIDTGAVKPSDVTVVTAEFALDEDDRSHIAAIDPELASCTYVFGRMLDNSWWHRIDGGPPIPTYGSVSKDLQRLLAHVERQAAKEDGDDLVPPRERLTAVTNGWTDRTRLSGQFAAQLSNWLQSVALPLIDEDNQTENNRYDRLKEAVRVHEKGNKAVDWLRSRLPTLVYFNNYFRVKPLIHLDHLATRLERKLLDDDQYDYGNQCFFAKLLGFSARELSDLGKAPEPAATDLDALRQYRDQLDRRRYRLNAASVRLTEQIREVWQPDSRRAEADTLAIVADQQYLKVVVEDDLGVEVELDQRSEGFQWLVSFFVVFFAEARDSHENAVLLLDEPGLSLHGLKQRDFRETVSRLAENNQTIYTTHSPFLVGPDELDMVRVVQMTDRRHGTVVHSTVTSDDPAALLPLQEALGYDLAQSLFAQQRNLILEGLTDYWYLDATALLLREAGVVDLNQRIALVPSNTAGKVVYFATILHAHNLKVAALLDSDAAGDAAAQQDTLVHTLGNNRILRTKDYYSGGVGRPVVEDLLRETLIEVAKSDPELGWDVSEAASKQPNRSIVSVFEGEVGNRFSKYRLAKAYIRWTRDHDASALTDDERTQWKSLIEAVNKALR